jgi:hypothetical protein
MRRLIEETLFTFNPIDLEGLNRAPLMNRTDEKFAFQINYLPEILNELTAHYDVLNIDGKVVFDYTSEYFDNQNFRFFSDHHRGIPHRYKVRVRTYLDTGTMFLEVKEKIKGRTDKKRISIKNFDGSFTEDQQLFLDKRLKEHIDLKSVMVNSYRRITLVNKFCEERLTIDFDITNGTFRNPKLCEQTLSKIVIAELKQPDLDRNSPFYRLMKKRGYRTFRLSKFCFGMMDLYPSYKLKANRFKPKFLFIKKLFKNVS